MKYAKYIILFLGICVVFSLCGELNQFNIYGFTSEYSHIDTSINSYSQYHEFVKKMLISAEDHNVGVFAEKEESVNGFEVEKEVFCNDRMRNELLVQHRLFQGKYESLLYDPVNISVKDANELTSMRGNIPQSFFFCGEEKSIEAFYLDIYQEDVVSFLQPGYDSSENDVLVLAWVCLGITFLLLSSFDILVSRKINFILSILGAKHIGLLVMDSVKSLLCMAVSWIAAFFLLKKFYFISSIEIHIVAIIIVFVLDVILRVILYRSNTKRALKQHEIGNSITIPFYIVKVITVALCTLLIAYFIRNVNDTKVYRKTLEDFSLMPSYSFINCYPQEVRYNIEEYYKHVFDSISKNYDALEPFYISEGLFYLGMDEDCILVEVSYHAKDFYEFIGNICENHYTEDYLILIPESMKFTDHQVQEEIVDGHSLMEYSYRVIRYDGVKQFSYFGAEKSETIDVSYTDNPIILVQNRDFLDEGISGILMGTGERQSRVLVKNDTSAFTQLLNDFANGPYIVTSAPVEDALKSIIKRQNRLTWTIRIVCILLILYSLLLTFRLSELEYLIKKRQFAVEIIVGKKLWESLSNTIIAFGIVYISILILILLVNHSLIAAKVSLCIVMVLVLGIIDILVFCVRISHLERSNLKNAISGGIYG